MFPAAVSSHKMIEELSLGHWPSLSTLFVDGWVLRFADGCTKRANSIQPIYTSTLDIHEKIKTCEQLYERNGLPTVFKITPFIHPENLDNILDEKGYSLLDRTSIQTRSLDGLKTPQHSDVRIDTYATNSWLNSFCRINSVDEKKGSTMTRMLSNIRTTTGYISLLVNDQVVACGLGVVERGYIGLYDIVTDKQHRNQGLAEQLILHLLHWGKAQGAEFSYLAVVVNNAPAWRLYEKLGYEEIYRYWYRVKKYL